MYPLAHPLLGRHRLGYAENYIRKTQGYPVSQLEDLDFADDLAFLSVKRIHLQEKTDRLERHAKQTGLTINTSKTQVMSINTTPTAPVTVNGEPLEFVQDFTYLGSLISKDYGGQKDIKARLGKARCAFAKLQ